MTDSSCTDSVQVCVRIRPEGSEADALTQVEDSADDGAAAEAFVRVLPPPEHLHDGSKTPGRTPGRRGSSTPWKTPRRPLAKQFAFDSVLGTGATNDDVFAKCAPLVTSAAEGYNATIFAYGSTGSGKTHSMIGPSDALRDAASAARGIVPRAIELLFDSIRSHEGHRVYDVRLTFVELYNDKFRDLLHIAPKSTTGGAPCDMAAAGISSAGNAHALEIKQDRMCGMQLRGSHTLRKTVKNPTEALDLVVQGQCERTTAETTSNTHSSRSHAILCLDIESTDIGPGACCTRRSKLYIVDLAGSETLAASSTSSSATNQETLAINLSLTTLSNVLRALSKKASAGSASDHYLVPFRDSKLTWLLRDSIGGSAKTLMLAHVRPTPEHYRQTMQTLAYAAGARSIRSSATVQKLDYESGTDSAATKRAIAEAQAAQQQVKRLSGEVKTLTVGLAERNARVVELESERAELRRQSDPGLFNQLQSLQAALRQAGEREQSAIEAAQSYREQAAIETERQQHAARKSLENARLEREGEVLQCRADVAELRAALEDERQQRRTQKVAEAELQGQLEGARAETFAVEQQLAKLTMQRDSLVRKLNTVANGVDSRAVKDHEQVCKMQVQLAEAQQRVADLEKAAADQQKMREFSARAKQRAEEESSAATAELAQEKRKVVALEQARSSLEAALQKAKASQQKAEERAQKAEAQVQTLQATAAAAAAQIDISAGADGTAAASNTIVPAANSVPLLREFSSSRVGQEQDGDTKAKPPTPPRGRTSKRARALAREVELQRTPLSPLHNSPLQSEPSKAGAAAGRGGKRRRLLPRDASTASAGTSGGRGSTFLRGMKAFQKPKLKGATAASTTSMVSLHVSMNKEN